MDSIEELLSLFTPSSFDLLTFVKFLLIAGSGCSLLAVILRLICGKRSNINHSVSAAIGIIMIYIVSIALFSAGSPYEKLISPLPFVTFAGEYLSVFPLQNAAFPEICHQIVRMMMLAFLVNLLDSIIPKGNKFIGWLLLRCVSVVLAIAGQWAISWVFTAILPDFLLTYAPAIILILIALLLAVSVFKLVIGVLLGATLGPVVGAIYTFFFSNIVGKQIVKAALTTAILTGLVALLNHFGYALILLTQSALIAFIPAVVILVLVWFLLFKLL